MIQHLEQLGFSTSNYNHIVRNGLTAMKYPLVVPADERLLTMIFNYIVITIDIIY